MTCLTAMSKYLSIEDREEGGLPLQAGVQT